MAAKKGRPKQKVNPDGDDPIMDPRQVLCWKGYTNPKSPTFGNAFRSGLAAGYTKSYSLTLTGRPWFYAKMRRHSMLNKAEKVLDKALTMETVGLDGKEQPELLRIQTDIAKHITKTLGKEEGYSERSEVTGKDGEGISLASVIFNAPMPVRKPEDES